MTVFDLSVTDDLLSTTRAVRKRLDLERAVPASVINDCLDLSQQAPTGSNKQGWAWVVVTDADKRAALGDMYHRGAIAYLNQAEKDAAQIDDAGQTSRVIDSALYLADKMKDVPVLVIPCINVGHMADNPPRAAWAGVMGSIMPAVWSFQLALRARGLGSVLTTLHLAHEKEASELLGIPDDFMQVALLPVAYTKGTDFKRAKRPPISEITHWEQW
ncbi:MAG: nitroreductase family protein [Rhodospirillaceae bacterium]|nr:nitroreductase family protein [Rhodospirillaceae bacterium]MBT4042669.1 nitroreductase family protein [Rhodospirillaceae bacterium]MBT4687758.1 nitroreductase family protein [Rhodospirillaceae bacterium]MBT5082818.1 nitroreductase family protein [Rhodospirillaceae bacterium]MBT5524262.1 nitroreductase family protein [Rhodospirillaceae bacterium]